MLYAVLSGFALAALVPWLHALSRQHIGWVLAILPASLTVYFASFVPLISSGESVHQSWDWLPGLSIELSFMLDGLALLFALLISFIGTFILIYAGGYLKGHAYLGRFFTIMLCFMASMLGLVLSDNLISLFIFWELTSITSYLLIGFNHEDAEARKSALQGLLVTVGGGLALMAGLIILGTSAGTFTLSEILAAPEALPDGALATGMILCLLAGAFTKSAQVPFHFWLPNAMAAPTPVSAYLHSATMVKAGIYLMARLNPAMGDYLLWTLMLSVFGALTMVTGAYLAYSSTGIKKVLAYSTIMALGTLTMLIGIGTPYAMMAFVCFLLAHSLYKGALFMIAGIIDHETGTKDLSALGGLRHSMPLTTLAAAVSAISLAGLPPLFGFVAKELMFEAVLSANYVYWLMVICALLSAVLTVAVAAVVCLLPFYGAKRETPKTPHEAPISLLAGPLVLGTVSLIFGLYPPLPEALVVSAAVAAVSGVPSTLHLALWHGFNLPLLFSFVGLPIGALLFLNWQRNRPTLNKLNGKLSTVGPEAGYFKILAGLVSFADWQTRVLQNGKLGNYMIVLVMSTVGLVGFTLLSQYGLGSPLNLRGINFYEWGISALMVIAVLFALFTRSRLAAVATMGVLGFTVALIFILFSAPDLGITQVLVETLTVILLVLVLFRLPGFARYSTRYEIIRDSTVSVLFGVLMTLLILAANDTHYFDTISGFFVDASYPLANGRNIVNVILVDFRALDTLGEIFVLSIAAMGVFSMIKLRAEVNDDTQS